MNSKPSRNVAVALITLVAAFLLAGCSQGNVFSLEPGDCFSASPSGELANVEIVGCNEPHTYEVYATFNLSGSVWPGTYTVDSLADDGCFARFKSFVGISYENSEWYISSLVPTKDSWEQLDDREIVCLIKPNFGAVAGSARGTRR